ncbi:MAG TPA: helix-turn-helix transcriptional regulator [Candidatus Acidoferrales bacterium]|nr:helix-turn-helix transcriptional regulator [Candidatus Acidoferrales bacterium]
MSEIWKEFDEGLFSLKLREPSLQMHTEVDASHRKIHFEWSRSGRGPHSLYLELIDGDIAIFREFLKIVDRMCRDVWRAQGNRVTAEFVRAIPNGVVISMIEARVGAIKGHIEMLAGQMHYDATGLYPVLDHLARTKNELISAVANRYEIESRELEYKEVSSSRSISEGVGRTSVQGNNVGETAEEKPNDVPKVRHITQAPAPPTVMRGAGLSVMSPKSTQIPSDLPPYYPNDLIPQTHLILAEAVRKFPNQTHTLELCKYVISKMTPYFREALQGETLRADLVFQNMDELLHYALVSNCDNGNQRFRLKQEARKSDEWLKLVKEIADVARKQSNKKSKEALNTPVSSFEQNSTHAKASDLETTTIDLRAQIEDAVRDTVLWLQADPSAEERVCVLAMQVRLADLNRILTHRIEGRTSPDEEGKLGQGVRELLSFLDKARQVRGHVVGKGLARLAARLAPLNTRERALEKSAPASQRDAKPTNERDLFVRPILDKKGWSILDWAKDSGVDFHTANNYLKGKTKPYKSTRTKLAKSLGVEVQKLPT